MKLGDILQDLWLRGIPVVPIEVLPGPSFQGAALVVEGRPVIVLSHKHDEPGRVAFLTAHEAGNIAAGDCTSEQPVVDEEDEVLDESEMETRADRYATRVLVGADDVRALDGGTFRQLASSASQMERTTGADASAILFAWASRTGDYPKASMAVKALYRGSGARQKLLEELLRHVDLEGATETDRALLRCVTGERERDAVADRH